MYSNIFLSFKNQLWSFLTCLKEKKEIEIQDGESKAADIAEFDVILALCNVVIATSLVIAKVNRLI